MTAIMYVDPDIRTTVTTSTGGSSGSGGTSGVVTIGGATATIGVTLANVSGATPLPVSFGGSSTIDVSLVSASNGTPVNVALPGVDDLNPLPVTFPTAGGMNVTVMNGSPIPVSFDASGGMDVNITNTDPLLVAVDGGSMTVTGTVNAVISNVTSTNPLPVEFSTAGGMDVALTTLLSGEDQANDWLKIADGATQGQHFIPTPTVSGGDQPTEASIGTAGAAGDYLKSIRINSSNTSNAAVYLSQDGAPTASSGTSGTAPTGTTTCSVTATVALTASANQYRGRIICVTYIPTGGSVPIKYRRRITAHTAFAAATALSFTVTHALPAGAAITAWTLEHSSAYELQPYNTPVGMQVIPIGETSTYGGWRLNTDSAVDAHVIGKFS